ncbi:MAG: hypothetical protein ABSF47_01420 [Minisyncoccia bacterium]|jgi:CRISPR-associated endonuclease Cas2
MAKTSRDARKHIRELSELFSGFEAVGYAVVENLLKKREQRKYLKQSLRRLIDSKFLIDNGDEFVPTARGVIHFSRILSLNKKISSAPRPWDNKWRLVSFDVPGQYNKDRSQIRSLLKEFGFCLLQKSVWICPNSISKKFWDVLVKSNLDRYCKTMVVEVIEGDEDLRKYFRLIISILAAVFLPDLTSF